MLFLVVIIITSCQSSQSVAAAAAAAAAGLGDSAPPFVGEEDPSTKRFVRSTSAGDKGADPYL
jgi:hypothetical protein